MFQGRNFLKEIDFTKEELTYLIDFSLHLKRLKQDRIPHPYLQGQHIALLFEKNSTRTRAAFTVAARDLGATTEFLGAADLQLGKKESVEDTARVLGSMFDGLEFRGYDQAVVEELADHAGVPVWNGLTDDWHPTQMIADFMTMKEEFGSLEGLKIVYCGDGRNNVANSLLVTAAILGLSIIIASPKALFPTEAVWQLASERAEASGAQLELTEDIAAAVVSADVLYTDVWVSMGEESETASRLDLLAPYQINQELVNRIENKAWIFLHCLPAFHDLRTDAAQAAVDRYGQDLCEVTDEVFRSSHGRQFRQAENRLHSIKAIMAATNGNLFIPKV